MRNKKVAKMILEIIINKSENPYLRSYKALPVNVFNKILSSLIKGYQIELIEKKLHIIFDAEILSKRIEGALKQHVLRDEVGLLIKHDASQATIRELTGINKTDVVDRRKCLGAHAICFGRPRTLDPKEKELIQKMWSEQDMSPAIKAISIALHTGISVDDVCSTASGKSTRNTPINHHASELN